MGSIPSILSHGVGQNVSGTKMVQNKNIHLMSSVCVSISWIKMWSQWNDRYESVKDVNGGW